MAPRPPDFPVDLERLIFELVALSHPVSIPNLMLVAWRVKNWQVAQSLWFSLDLRCHCDFRVEPLLYRTLVFNVDPIEGLLFCPEEAFRMIARAKPALLRGYVRNLLVLHELWADDIAAFPAMENL
ncbi:hypothetical protein B0H17DRAFT_1216056 [Mycena rosella]|uniref:Uncharacterized protein n=1 Tax=Mycena rosella TaxID=1033263 RepID=A0AAD7CCV0_MYCRO|nr:hypothetical protein B0H17DRAFT_1216056 [Mycena rosella]